MNNLDTPTVANSSKTALEFDPVPFTDFIGLISSDNEGEREQAEIEMNGVEWETLPQFQASQRSYPSAEQYKSDVAYADAFAKKFKDILRYIHEEETWLIFDPEKGWHRDTSGEVLSHFTVFARSLYNKALSVSRKIADHKTAAATIAAAAHLGNMNRIAPALQFVKVDRDIIVSIQELDREPYLLGTQNGVVDLRDGSFRPHDPSVLVTRSVACTFDPRAECPTFMRFLAEVQPDPEMRAYLQRLFGYALTGHMGENILPFHYGVGANGKGTTLEQTFLKLMGSYGAKVTDELVYTNSKGTAPHLEIAGLCGIRFAVGEENEAGGNLNERLLKAITGGDRQKGRFHYKPFFEYTPTAKIHLVGNHRPKITGRDDGIWRRFRLIHWDVQIPAERQDHRFSERLEPEFPGILKWAIEGELARGAEGTRPPTCVLDATSRFREESDVFGDFFREKTVDDENARIPKAQLYTLYKEYCDDQEIQPRYRITKRVFGNRIVERGYDEARGRGGEHVWRGLRKRVIEDTPLESLDD